MLPVHLLVPHHAEPAVLVRTADSRAELPSVDLELRDGETVVNALRRRLAREWDLDVAVLETHLPPPASGDDGDYVGLAVLDRMDPGWVPPDGLAWGPADVDPAGPIATRAHRWLAEWATGQAVPELRPRWSRAGWYERALAWIDTSLASHGRDRHGAPEVRRLWTLSVLMRVGTTDGGAAWFKAVFPSFGHEPAVTRVLHERLPDAVPAVLAADEAEGWALLDDVGGEPLGATADDDALARAVGRLVQVATAAEPEHDRLVALGCPRRPIDRLAAALGAAMVDARALDGPTIAQARLDRAVRWVEEASRLVASAGIPDRLVHGDFTVFNVIDRPAGPALIDWSDAAISHPLVDIGPWLGHPDAPGDPERQFDAWLDALAPFGDVGRLRDARDAAMGVSCAYHLVSYAGILRNVEPENHYQLSDGFRGFWALLDDLVPN